MYNKIIFSVFSFGKVLLQRQIFYTIYNNHQSTTFHKIGLKESTLLETDLILITNISVYYIFYNNNNSCKGVEVVLNYKVINKEIGAYFCTIKDMKILLAHRKL